MKKLIFFLLASLLILSSVFIRVRPIAIISPKPTIKPKVRITSIDTMKYSRDLALEKLKDLEFDEVIDRQIKHIAETGSIYVAIDTPYDDKFLPFLRRWVKLARKYKLKVWFRGNFSGWERWFGYEAIDRQTHIIKTVKFIYANSDIFENGDIFGACNECENGGPGDPRQNGDIKGHREFIIKEYKATRNAFEKIGKKVASNYNSMNGDVASLIMDKETTKALDGVVVIDHYVASPDELMIDIIALSKKSGGKIVLGEFGTPIPDINGKMTDQEQKEWLIQVLKKLFSMQELIGMNYWTNVGSSTQLWDSRGNPRPAVEIIKKYYKQNKSNIL